MVTIGSITEPVTLAVTWTGTEQDGTGKSYTGFSATARIKRSDFAVGKSFGGLIADTLAIALTIRLQEPAAA